MLGIQELPIDLSRVFFSKDGDELNEHHRRILSHTRRFDDGSILAAFHVREDLIDFEINGRPVLAGSIFLVDPNPNAPEHERLEWNGHALHEAAHANGASEIQSRITERDYLISEGLKGPSNYQILKEIADNYCNLTNAPYMEAYRTFFGEEPSMYGWGALRHLLRINRFRMKSVRRYNIEEDWRTTIGLT